MTKAEVLSILRALEDFLPRTSCAGSSNGVKIADLRTATCSDSLGRGSWSGNRPGEGVWPTCLWRIDSMAVKPSNPRNALQLRAQTRDDFHSSFLATLTVYRSELKSLKSQAAIGV
jgi:hypothetical protein